MARKSYNGVYYEDNLDHEAEISEAAERGDYETAAFYEKRRNAKIEGEGLNYEKTYRYIDRDGNSQHLGDELNSLYSANRSKGSGWNGSQSSRINSLMNGIMSMPSFSYDAQKDPIYQQYKAQAEESAKRATEDTMASYAGMTGGVPSSYAVMAGQQAGERYRRSADDKIPELYQLAYSMYADERADKYNQLNTLLALDQNEYNRYRDTVLDEQWREEYEDSYYWKDKEFQYGADQDKKSWEYKDKELANSEKKAARENVWQLASYDIPPKDEEMIAAGYEGMSGQELVDAIRNREKWALDLQAQNTKGFSPAEDEIDENKVQAILTKHTMGKDLTTSEMELLIKAGYKYDENEDVFVLVEEESEGDPKFTDTKALEIDLMSQPDIQSRKAKILSWLDNGVVGDDEAIKIASKFGIDLVKEYGL